MALVAVVLAFAAGATDAFAFLQLSGVFTANMTGNLVLGGLVDRPGYGSTIAGITTAIVVFAGTLFLALRFMPGDTPTGRTVILLVVAAVAQAAILGMWAVGAGGASPVAVVVLTGLSAMAMACQTAIAKRIDGASGVTTTYVTGTITSLMADAADRKPQPAGIRLAVIAALVVGALGGAVAIHADPLYGAALPLLPAVVAAALTATTITPRRLTSHGPGRLPAPIPRVTPSHRRRPGGESADAVRHHHHTQEVSP
ncbi:YoaK family protein [Microbacterium sp. 1P10AE]|uniref:YoaK family protein n=1 Tax=Microbacterium sp. 1P10AE TaxID=3132286 RepID=UPI0039A13191